MYRVGYAWVSAAWLLLPAAVGCHQSASTAAGVHDAGARRPKDAGNDTDSSCPAGIVHGPCLSTTPCTTDSDCAALGSSCNDCAGYCGCGSATDAGTRDAGALTPLPACRWPANLDQPDAAAGSCHAARTLLSCKYPRSSGATVICLSSDLGKCPGIESADCHDLCSPDEYAISCGAIGRSPDPSAVQPPPGCGKSIDTPAGIIDECCPCQR